MTPVSRVGNSMFTGSIVALVTPFTDEGGVDYSALGRLVDFHLDQGSDALVVAGTTGESATLAKPEFRELLAAVIRSVDGAIPVLAGTGSTATATAVEQTVLAGDLGADGALVVTPYYNRPTQAGLEAHFTAVADASAIPVVLYNVPSRTAVDLLPETVQSLSSHPRIVGIKEAVRDPGRIDELLQRCGTGFTVLSGDDPSCLAALQRGAGGVVSVAANVAPALMRQLCAAAAARDWATAQGIDRRLRPLFDMLAVETNPIPVKWALFEMKRAGPHIRLPLTQLEQAHRRPLRQCLETLELLGART
jgi:4-hydroxy-tetrahydrodipicolinate synthase